jgi:hypothetical protein
VVRLWSLASGTEERSFTAHSGPIVSVGFNDNGFRAFSASGDGTVRVWYLDWEVSAQAPADWDESARGWLEVFLARRAARSGPGPVRWGRQDLEELMTELRRRGLGWLEPEGVRTQLRRMAGGAAAEPQTRVRSSLPTTTAVTPREVRQRRYLMRAAIVALLALIGLTIGGARMVERSRLRVVEREVERARANIRKGVLPLRRMAAGRVRCLESEHDAYLDAYLGRAGDIRYDPIEAKICLAMVGNTRTIRPLLDSLRPRDRSLSLDGIRGIGSTGSFGDVGSILAHLDESTITVQARALGDPEPAIRKVVATALVARGSRRAIEALLDHAFDEDSRTREAIATHFMEIVASGVLEPEDALELASRWAGDSSAEVRRLVASELGILAGSRVMSLMEQLRNDPDPEVRDAASRTLARFR